MIWFALPDVHIMIVIDFLLCIALDGIAGRDVANSTKRLVGTSNSTKRLVGTLWSETKKSPCVVHGRKRFCVIQLRLRQLGIELRKHRSQHRDLG